MEDAGRGSAVPLRWLELSQVFGVQVVKDLSSRFHQWLARGFFADGFRSLNSGLQFRAEGVPYCEGDVSMSVSLVGKSERKNRFTSVCDIRGAV